MSKKIALTLFTAFLLTGMTKAQIVPDVTYTPQQLVEDFLVGPGISVSGVTFNGAPGTTLNNQIGFFSGNSSIGLDSGIVITNGLATNVTGPNNSSSIAGSFFTPSFDPDLSAIGFSSVYDAGILEFDFVPTGDTVSFRFVFGSDEYLEWIGVNDMFGIFLSGPGITGPYSMGAQNIATIPGGIPVSINNINPGSNPSYYVNNGDGFTAPYSTNPYYIEYDGHTVIIKASWPVSCGSTYHIKFAIGDAGDDWIDSGVFIEAGSLMSSGSQVSANVEPVFGAGPNSVFEGCLLGDTVSLVFTRPTTTGSDTLFFNLGGDAINGVDYTLISPAYVVFPAGEDSVTLSFGVPNDGIVEGVDTLIISIPPSSSGGCGSGPGNTLEVYIYDPYGLNAFAGNDTVYQCPGQTLVFNGTTLNGNPPYAYTWSDGTLGATINYTITALGGDTLVMSVTDGCGYNGSDTLIMTQVAPTSPLTANAGPDVYFTCPGDTSLVFATATGGVAPYTYLWEGIFPGPSYYYVADSDTVVIVTVTDFCGNTDSDTLYAINTPPIPLVVDAGPDQTVTCVGQYINLNGTVTGGSGYTGWYWSTTETTLAITVQPLTTSTYIFTAFNTCGQVDSDTVLVNVPPYTPLSYFASDTNIVVNCPGNSQVVTVYATGGGSAPYSYSWSNMDNDSTTNAVVTGTDTLLCTITDACGLDTTVEIPMSVLGSPITLDFPDGRYCRNADSSALVPFTVTGGLAPFSYTWTTQPGGTAYFVDTIGLGFTIYDVTNGFYNLTVTDQCGSSDSDTGQVIMKDCDLVIPNVISPNGDGSNDFFVVDDITLHPNSILRVYDRWGVLVYYDTNYLNTWDGGGAATGVYFYILELTDGSIPGVFTGYISIFY
ncbi:MAG TPA: choice-of-anchor L domain-containing protein [Flavobacteriales bacterium]|nr:choice-of-anchor L domain-containing protein [Flavobacteriales bacterium]